MKCGDFGDRRTLFCNISWALDALITLSPCIEAAKCVKIGLRPRRIICMFEKPLPTLTSPLYSSDFLNGVLKYLIVDVGSKTQHQCWNNHPIVDDNHNHTCSKR
jgi:hypothetical protein